VQGRYGGGFREEPTDAQAPGDGVFMVAGPTISRRRLFRPEYP
jgi:hypothetical protein